MTPTLKASTWAAGLGRAEVKSAPADIRQVSVDELRALAIADDVILAEPASHPVQERAADDLRLPAPKGASSKSAPSAAIERILLRFDPMKAVPGASKDALDAEMRMLAVARAVADFQHRIVEEVARAQIG